METVAFARAPEFMGDPIVFTGSSESDKSYAKSFWQSMNLCPHMESRLVSSSEVRQRLKSAPPLGQDMQRSCSQQNFNSSSNKGFEKPNPDVPATSIEEIKRIERFAYFREADLQRMKLVQQKRVELENNVSKSIEKRNKASRNSSRNTSKNSIYSSDLSKNTVTQPLSSLSENTNNDVLDTIKQIEQFEEKLSASKK